MCCPTRLTPTNRPSCATNLQCAFLQSTQHWGYQAALRRPFQRPAEKKQRSMSRKNLPSSCAQHICALSESDSFPIMESEKRHENSSYCTHRSRQTDKTTSHLKSVSQDPKRGAWTSRTSNIQLRSVFIGQVSNLRKGEQKMWSPGKASASQLHHTWLLHIRHLVPYLAGHDRGKTVLLIHQHKVLQRTRLKEESISLF